MTDTLNHQRHIQELFYDLAVDKKIIKLIKKSLNKTTYTLSSIQKFSG